MEEVQDNMNFQDIVAEIMKFIDQNPSVSEDDLISHLSSEFNLDKEASAELGEVFSDINCYNDKAISLEEAREEGMTRDGWLAAQLEESIKNFDEKQQEEYMTNLANAMETEAAKYVENDEEESNIEDDDEIEDQEE